MSSLPFMIMTALEAARFREATTSSQNQLDPREVEAGTYAGHFVLPERVKFDANFAANLDVFEMLDVVAIDPDQAWPFTEA